MGARVGRRERNASRRNASSRSRVVHRETYAGPLDYELVAGVWIVEIVYFSDFARIHTHAYA